MTHSPKPTNEMNERVTAFGARQNLDRWTERCEASPIDRRCADCAFRPGTPANRDRFTAMLITVCASHPADTPEGNFCCHHRAEGVTCSGFALSREDL